MNVTFTTPWTVERFLIWAARQEERYEFDGKQPVAMTGASGRHSRIMGNIHAALRDGRPDRMEIAPAIVASCQLRSVARNYTTPGKKLSTRANRAASVGCRQPTTTSRKSGTCHTGYYSRVDAASQPRSFITTATVRCPSG
nr:hypothetical protein [uncultured Rhodopila sp.]